MSRNWFAQQRLSETNHAEQEDLYEEESRARVVEDLCNKSIEEILNTDIYVMSFNVSVKTRQDAYIPIEIGVVKLNLQEGIKGFHHEFIDGGRTPIGQGFEIKEHMERYHRIPLYDISEYPVAEMAATESKQEHIDSLKNSMAAINNFIQAERVPIQNRGFRRNTESVQPVYTLPDLDGLGLKQTTGCLRRMADEVGRKDFYDNYLVCDLTYLLFCLYKRGTGTARPMALCSDDFFRVIHSYEPHTNCEFHDTTDTPHCALSRSYRFSYVILDVLIPIFKIKVTPAHRPKPSKPPVEHVFPPMAPKYQRYLDEVERQARAKGTYWSDK